jgi:FixJ family two-component response regulator
MAMEMSSLKSTMDSDVQEVLPDSLPDILAFAPADLPRFTIHIIDGDITDRASTFRLFSEFGYHCEIYSNLSELIAFRPTSGVAVVHERPGETTVAMAVEQTRAAGLGLTIAGCAKSPTIDSVIAAMQAGAQHYFVMPFVRSKVEIALKALMAVNKAHQQTNELRAQALVKLRRLSVRERQVVGLLVDGHSNKSIARILDISPRTVEIHRMKAMGKLGAQSASEAVRIWLVGAEQLGE